MRIWEFIYLSIEAARAAGDKSPALDQSGLIGLRPSGSACVFVCVHRPPNTHSMPAHFISAARRWVRVYDTEPWDAEIEI